MIKVDQRFEHNPPESIGDCHAACLATILEVPIEGVPRVKGTETTDIETWWAELGNWLNSDNWYLFKYTISDKVNQMWLSPSDPPVWIAGGESQRGGLHCVVMQGNDMFHDPHQSRSGLIGITFAEILVSVNPSKPCVDCWGE